MTTTPEWDASRYAVLASALRRILDELGMEHQYHEDEDWIKAKLAAHEALRTLLTTKAELIAAPGDVVLVRRTMACINGDDPNPDQLEAVLTSLSEHFESDEAVLFDDVRYRIEAAEDDPEEDPLPLLPDLVASWDPLESIDGRRVSLTGEFIRGTREDVVAAIEAKGASWIRYPADGAELLVIGTFSVGPEGHVYPSQKVQQILTGEAKGVRVVHEFQLLPALA